MWCNAVRAGILTVEGCLGDEGQESESGELCLGAGAHSYQQEAQHDESRKLPANYKRHNEDSQSEVSEEKKMNQQPGEKSQDCVGC